MATLALSPVVVLGVKVTLIVQLPFVASVLGLMGQVLVWAKSPLLVPVRPMLLMVKGAVPLLVSVTVLAALVVPVVWFPNARLLGFTVTAGAVPVPLRPTLSGLSAASSVMVTLAVRLPVADGLKVTLIEQVPLTASVLGLTGQVFVWPKSPLLVPVTAMLLIVSGPVPLLVSVTVWAALVVPVC
jgi:hypothetical protein